MSAKGSTAIDVLLNWGTFRLFRDGLKCLTMPAAITPASIGRSASFHSRRLRKEDSCAEEAAAGSTVFSVPGDMGNFGCSAGITSSTGATNRYPRLGKVSM